MKLEFTNISLHILKFHVYCAFCTYLPRIFVTPSAAVTRLITPLSVFTAVHKTPDGYIWHIVSVWTTLLSAHLLFASAPDVS